MNQCNCQKIVVVVFHATCTNENMFLLSDRFACEPGALWVPFQTAAGTVTSLYKGR